MTETRSLHRKLAEVMAEAERIPKRGKAPVTMGGYAFVQVGDAADAIRKALAARAVSMLPTTVEVLSESEHETRSGGTMTTQTLRTTWTLTDGETGESTTIQSLGTGADSGDKFSPKAQTNAMKYALLMGFLLSTGDDPEADVTAERGRRVVAGGRPPDVTPPERVDRETGEIRPKDAPIPLGPYIGEGAVFVRAKPPTDGLLRTGPTGFYIVFGLDLGGGKHIAQVHAQGALAADLMDALGGKIDQLIGQKVLLEGELFRVPFVKDGRDLAFERLELGRIETAEFTLPAPDLISEGQKELFGEPMA